MELADAIGLIEKVVAIAQRFLCVLVDRDRDRLDVLIAMALARGPLAEFGERLKPRRIVRPHVRRSPITTARQDFATRG